MRTEENNTSWCENVARLAVRTAMMRVSQPVGQPSGTAYRGVTFLIMIPTTLQFHRCNRLLKTQST